MDNAIWISNCDSKVLSEPSGYSWVSDLGYASAFGLSWNTHPSIVELRCLKRAPISESQNTQKYSMMDQFACAIEIKDDLYKHISLCEMVFIRPHLFCQNKTAINNVLQKHIRF